VTDGRIFVQPTLLKDGTLVIGPKHWDVSKERLDRLKTIVGELERLVRAAMMPRAVASMKPENWPDTSSSSRAGAHWHCQPGS
jgi:hypothetical protein